MKVKNSIPSLWDFVDSTLDFDALPLPQNGGQGTHDEDSNVLVLQIAQNWINGGYCGAKYQS